MDLARLVVANEHGIKILVVVGEVGGSGFRRGRAVAGSVLAEIGDRQFRLARMIFQEIFQLGRRCTRGIFDSGILAASGGGAAVACAATRVAAAQTTIIPRTEFRMTGPI